MLAHLFSAKVPNYSASSVDTTYSKSNGSVKFGSLLTWAKEDNSELTRLAMTQSQVHARVVVDASAQLGPSQLDERVIHGMAKAFNEKWREELLKLKDKNCSNPGQIIQEWQKDQQQLNSNTVQYMNKFLFIIRRSTGQPNIWEEMVIKTDSEKIPWIKHAVLEQQYAIRAPPHLKTAYRKHGIYIVSPDGSKRQDLADLWLDDMNSREFDRVDFNPVLSDRADPRVFNLFRGLGVHFIYYSALHCTALYTLSLQCTSNTLVHVRTLHYLEFLFLSTQHHSVVRVYINHTYVLQTCMHRAHAS